jgi:XTP/dITP diphosphohydrolase
MRDPLSLVLATRNPHKVAEIRDLLADLPVRLLPADALDAPPEVEEDAPTLQGNARKKAMALHRHTGQPALADDTGLEVDALDGAPGVRTARFAGPDATPADNNEKLLRALQHADTRRARFRTVAAFVDGEEVHYFEGVCAGSIAGAPRGKQGFGYDPLFVPEGEQRTFAEMSAAQKNAISHRQRAFHQFATFLRERLEVQSRS